MNYRKACFRCYHAFRRLIAPTLEHHNHIYDKYLWNLCHGAWLDLGCGAQLLPPWSKYKERDMKGHCRYVVGLDYCMDSLKRNVSLRRLVRGDISCLPFMDNSFDVVTANMVFEHLQEPGKQLSEIYRILKPGGLLIFATPNAHGYDTALGRWIPDIIKKPIIQALDGRSEEDVFSAHYRINTGRDIAQIADVCGYEVDEIRPVATAPQFIMFPPLALLELLIIKLLMTQKPRRFRQNIIAVLRKP